MSNSNNQGDPAILLVLVIVLFAGLGWLVWHATQGFFLDYFFRWLRYGEVWIVNLFTHHYDACLDWLRYAKVKDANPSPDIQAVTNSCFGPSYLGAMPAADRTFFYSMSMPPLLALGAMVSLYYRWPVSILMACIGIYILFYSPKTKFRTKHTLESFIEAQSKMWPIITPILKFNPSKSGRIMGDEIPDKLPMFAEPLSPEEWISWNQIAIVNGIPDRDASRRAFTQQLGPRWTGIENAPPHMRALYAAFCVKAAQKRDESDELLGALALAWSPEKGFRMDSKLADRVAKIIRDPEMGGKAKVVAEKHAWRTTAMLSVLAWARANGGVLAPAQFVWLRAEDRPLWYPLNNLGRRSFHSEGAGAMAHYMAELAAQKPLPIPRVDTAYVTLHHYLHPSDDTNRVAQPIPPRAKTT